MGTGLVGSLPTYMRMPVDAGASVSIPTEPEFRRILVAKQIQNLSNIVSGEALLIYPRGHWNIIKGYLENEEEMQKRYNLYENLRKIPGGETFFQARHWNFTQTGWELKEKIALPQ